MDGPAPPQRTSEVLTIKPIPNKILAAAGMADDEQAGAAVLPPLPQPAPSARPLAHSHAQTVRLIVQQRPKVRLRRLIEGAVLLGSLACGASAASSSSSTDAAVDDMVRTAEVVLELGTVEQFASRYQRFAVAEDGARVLGEHGAYGEVRAALKHL